MYLTLGESFWLRKYFNGVQRHFWAKFEWRWPVIYIIWSNGFLSNLSIFRCLIQNSIKNLKKLYKACNVPDFLFDWKIEFYFQNEIFFRRISVQKFFHELSKIFLMSTAKKKFHLKFLKSYTIVFFLYPVWIWKHNRKMLIGFATIAMCTMNLKVVMDCNRFST